MLDALPFCVMEAKAEAREKDGAWNYRASIVLLPLLSDRLAAPRRSTGRRCHCPRPPPPLEAGKSTAGSLRHLCPAVLLAAVEAA